MDRVLAAVVTPSPIGPGPALAPTPSVLVAGSTGEGPYLEPGERAALVAAARASLPRRGSVICGIAGESLAQAMRQVEEAAEAGADAVLVLTPTTLIRGRHALVARFYTDVADRSPLPVWLYSVPVYTAYELPTDVAVKLAHQPNVVGMKDSGGDPVRMADLRAGVPEGFLLYTGSTPAIVQAILGGADGAITASANYVPELVTEVVRAARRNPRAAMHLQRRLTHVARFVEAHGVPGVRAAVESRGVPVGPPRRPLRPLPKRTRERIAEAVRAALSD